MQTRKKAAAPRPARPSENIRLPASALNEPEPAGAGLQRPVALLVIALLLVPIWAFPYLPLNDWPNHLASVQLLADHDRGLPAYIAPNPDFLQPNGLLFALLRLLTPLAGLDLAGRLMLTLTLALFALSLGYLFRSIRPDLEAFGWAVGAAGAYNWFFMMGFVNYILGLGLAFVALGWWLSKRGAAGGAPALEAGPLSPRDALAFSLLSLLALWAHPIAALGLLAAVVCVRGVELLGETKSPDGAVSSSRWVAPGPHLSRALSSPALRIELLALAPAATALLFYARAFLSAGGPAWAPQPLNALLYLLITPPVYLVSLLGLALLALYAAMRLSRRGDSSASRTGEAPAPAPRHRPDARWLSPALLFALLALLGPEHIANWQFAAPRLWPLAIVFAALAFGEALARAGRAGRSLLSGLTGGLLALALVQLALLSASFLALQSPLSQLDALGSSLPPGSAVVALGDGWAEVDPILAGSPYFHAWGYWTLSAARIYSPYLFSYGYSPLRYADPDAHAQRTVAGWIDRLTFQPASEDRCEAWQAYYGWIDWGLVQKEYDYVAWRPGPCAGAVQPPSERFSPAGGAAGAVLYRAREFPG